MAWRLLRLLTGKYRPGPPPDDLDEARQRRREAERELAHTRSRSAAVDRAVAGLEAGQDVDEFAALIEAAFARKDTRR